MSEIVKQGYVKVKSKNLGKWNKRWLVLRRASPRIGNSVRLEKYESEAAASATASSHCAVYDLSRNEVISRVDDSSKPGVYVVLSDYSTVQFAADSNSEADSWFNAIQQAITGNDIISNNELFEVYVMQSAQLKSSGECLLKVTADSVQLLDIDDPRRVHLSWPLSGIRRYTVERGMFSLEAGRKCPSGEGTFMFDTKDPEAIFERVQSAARALARNKQDSDEERYKR